MLPLIREAARIAAEGPAARQELRHDAGEEEEPGSLDEEVPPGNTTAPQG
eukprot:CAMPEP_0202914822 /NCGR_PEP_ID=MMETSP1392-20130828/64107_1 /ASSEMBLY_ACC=CAM_ASM_000868 /TAXON_ID=225041 /ORGANISM="Chlamydomonas chlamydogama, Strain SAG 11-48b" /LENGTH=49 /DNA_ID=CAMNT_0049606629 /DNA_START=1 /DNA_END=150 /DNA_ORIENTATION=+